MAEQDWTVIPDKESPEYHSKVHRLCRSLPIGISYLEWLEYTSPTVFKCPEHCAGRAGGSCDEAACLLHRKAAEAEFGPSPHPCTWAAPRMEPGLGWGYSEAVQEVGSQTARGQSPCLGQYLSWITLPELTTLWQLENLWSFSQPHEKSASYARFVFPWCCIRQVVSTSEPRNNGKLTQYFKCCLSFLFCYLSAKKWRQVLKSASVYEMVNKTNSFLKLVPRKAINTTSAQESKYMNEY